MQSESELAALFRGMQPLQISHMTLHHTGCGCWQHEKGHICVSYIVVGPSALCCTRCLHAPLFGFCVVSNTVRAFRGRERQRCAGTERGPEKEMPKWKPKKGKGKGGVNGKKWGRGKCEAAGGESRARPRRAGCGVTSCGMGRGHGAWWKVDPCGMLNHSPPHHKVLAMHGATRRQFLPPLVGAPSRVIV
jgi:hypothetical protein